MNNKDVGSFLSGLRGNRVKRVRRVHYVHEGRVAVDEGPVELTFADGAVVLFDGGSDGESLTVKGSRWVDPFPEPLSPENVEFVKESGKWTAFDVTRAQPYEKLIEDRIVNAIPIKGRKDKITGVVLVFSGNSVRIEIQGDETRVFFD